MEKLKQVKFNLQPDPPDDRDKIKVVKPIKKDKLPSIFSLKEYSGNIYDQGSIGACTGYALCKAREILMRRKYKGLKSFRETQVQFAPLFTYALARAFSGSENEDSGAFVRDAFKSAHKVGMLPYEYYNGNNDWKYLPNNEERDFAKYGKIEGYESVANISDIIEIIYYEELPVVIGISIFNMTVDGQLIYGDGDLLGGHALVIDSFNLTDFNGIGSFSGPNSWGLNWGNYGRYKIDFNYAKTFIFSAWTFSTTYY